MVIDIPHNFAPETRPWQLDALLDERKMKVLCVGRRHGKTSLALNKLIIEAMLPENAGKLFMYLCPTQRQAKDVVWRSNEMLFNYLPEQAIDKKNEVDLTVRLVNGSLIYIRGTDNEHALRGLNPFGIVLDEYAQMKPNVFDEIFKPVLAANGGWAWFISTPFGKNHFYRLYRYGCDNMARWQVIHLKASESGIIPEEALEEARRSMPEKTFLQEFEAEFLDDAGTIFRRIRECINGGFEEPKQGRLYKVGVDLARTTDWTVITVVDRHTHKLVHFERFQQIDYNLQKARIEAVARRYNNAPITVDETGVGAPITEDLRRMGLLVTGFTFTATSKKQLIENLAIKIEQGKMTYPEIPELIRELEEFTYELLPSGAVRYTAPEGGTDDAVCSLALAMWQIGELIPASTEKSNYGFNFSLNNGYKKLIFK